MSVFAAPAALTVTRTSGQPILALVEATGAPAGTTVAVSGTGPSGATVETLTFLANVPLVRGRTRFTALSNNACAASGLTVSVKAIYESGAEAPVWALLGATVAGRLWLAVRPTVAFGDSGPQLVSRAYFATNELTMTAGDQLVLDGTTYHVEHAHTVYDSVKPHHRQCTLQALST